MKNITVVCKAGGIITRGENPTEVLLLYRTKQDDWTFPKGHVEKDESCEQAALREVYEETGLSLDITAELPEFEYQSPSEKTVRTKMYLMRQKDDSVLKEEHEGDKLVWVPLAEVSSRLSYEGLKLYFEKIQSMKEFVV